MRGLALGVCLLAGFVSRAEAVDPTIAGLCLSAGDSLEAVTTHQVVRPGQAIAVARKSVPNADVLRAALCHEAEGLTYRVMLLRKDGRLVRVTIDAASGMVKAVH